MNDIDREVNFNKYCKTCQYEKQDEKFDPCCECLDYGYNAESHKPVNWKEKSR
jgi:hypothetical protein